MRQIKFKAKRLDNGEWVEGLPILYKVDGSYMWRECREPVRIDPNTLCQFTGLKDKDGKEIWEHDIVEAPLDKAEIVYNEKYACFDYIYPDGSRCAIVAEIEGELKVIGNKFDKEEKE